MHIDFAPPASNGIYNNAGSSRQLANYLEHEDLVRMEKSLYTEGFFNLTDDNIYKSKVIKDIDTNIGQLLKTDAKFYAIHVSSSEKELRAIGSTEQRQVEAMKRYIREVFIPEYANNFNKGLSEANIKFYGKIHFSHNRSNNELNMHCHLIVSRKDQSNKKKVVTTYQSQEYQERIIKGGFDRVNLFQQVEQGFDKLFCYERQQTESFNNHNMIKNGTISEQFKLQKQEIQSIERKAEINQDSNQENLLSIKTENYAISNSSSYMDKQPDIENDNHISNHQYSNKEDNSLGDSVFSLIANFPSNPNIPKEQLSEPKKKKRKDVGYNPLSS